MSIEKVVEKLNREILQGLEFTVPGETEKARRELYCSQRDVDFCNDCSLVNYGRDCKNNKVEKGLNWSTMKMSTR